MRITPFSRFEMGSSRVGNSPFVCDAMAWHFRRFVLRAIMAMHVYDLAAMAAWFCTADLETADAVGLRVAEE